MEALTFGTMPEHWVVHLAGTQDCSTDSTSASTDSCRTSGGRIFGGAGTPGRNVKFARIGPSGRYEPVVLNEADGSARAWLSGCSNVIKTVNGGGVSSGSKVCGNPARSPSSDDDPGGLIFDSCGGEDDDNDWQTCNFDMQYNNIDDLIAQQDYIRGDCLSVYMLQVSRST